MIFVMKISAPDLVTLAVCTRIRVERKMPREPFKLVCFADIHEIGALIHLTPVVMVRHEQRVSNNL